MTTYDRLRRQLLDRLDADRIDPAEQPDRVRTLVARLVAEYQRDAEIGTEARLRDVGQMATRLVESVTAYGPLTHILAAPDVEEIFVEGPRVTWMDRTGRLHGLDVPTTEEENRAVVDRLLAPTSRSLDTRNPMVQARVLDGAARLSVAVPPVAEGLSATIRRHTRRRHSLADLVGSGSLSMTCGSGVISSSRRTRKGAVVRSSSSSGSPTIAWSTRSRAGDRPALPTSALPGAFFALVAPFGSTFSSTASIGARSSRS